MLYNRCTGIYKFGNNTHPRRIRRRSNLGHIFREKCASYGPGNTKKVHLFILNYLYGTSCCRHADQIMPQISAPYKMLSKSGVERDAFVDGVRHTYVISIQKYYRLFPLSKPHS